MARSLNSKGREELASLRRRVTRQLALERITPSSASSLLNMIDQLDSAIITTDELDDPNHQKESLFSV